VLLLLERVLTLLLEGASKVSLYHYRYSLSLTLLLESVNRSTNLNMKKNSKSLIIYNLNYTVYVNILVLQKHLNL
jgi:hypothetical protein